jgi:asparagine synthase (glutamine-hydrolysing)
MCGIIGQINFKSQVDEAVFSSMRDILAHRGPDGFGSWFSDDRTIALGHRRLSFLDLTESGKQPMCNEDETLWLTFNGEIYNYVELKKELELYGHQFKSTTDSEVIIHGFEQWGKDLLNKLKGMFAFALWQEKEKKLFLARDRFGIKPLYYYQNNHNFIFASEIKAIVENPKVEREIDFSSMADYLTYRYVPSPKTIWKNIRKLPAANYLELDLSGNGVVTEYWKIHYGSRVMKASDAVDKVDELLMNSVATHIRSDVPVGSFLSGGYDSSALVYYLSRINYKPQTFSIGFEGWKESEHLYAEMVAKQFGTKHTSTIVGAESLDILEKLASVYDEPLADISIIPTYLVSQAASKKVKTVFSGEGADELFCGYSWHYALSNTSPIVSNLLKLKSFFTSRQKNYFINQYAQAMAMGRFEHNNITAILNPDLQTAIPNYSDWFYADNYIKNLSTIKAFQNMDIKCFMGELVLTKIDRASMANSLEVRVPFLDHELYEFVLSLNDNVYFKPGEKKFLLSENIKNHLPEKIMNRQKQGFVGPDSYYMDIERYASLLRNGRLIKEQIIRHEKLEELILQNDYWKLWKMAVLEFWYSRWN